MQLMQKSRTHQVVKSFTLKFQPSNKYFGGNKRGRTKRMNTKQPQNLDPTSSPHLEEILFGGRTDLDLLSCFPKNGQKSLEGSGGIELSRFAKKVERERKRAQEKWGRRPLFIVAHEK